MAHKPRPKCVIERLNGTATDSLDTSGLDVEPTHLAELLSVDNPRWREAVPQIRDHYAAFGARLPNELATALDALESSLS